MKEDIVEKTKIFKDNTSLSNFWQSPYTFLSFFRVG